MCGCSITGVQVYFLTQTQDRSILACDVNIARKVGSGPETSANANRQIPMIG